MLPQSYSQAYHNLLDKLLKLQNLLGQPESAPTEVKGSFEQTQALFLERTLRLSGDGLDPGIRSRWQSVQTEMHRTFRLLATDFWFWASARQSTSREQRKRIIDARVEQLINYCRLLQEGNCSK